MSADIPYRDKKINYFLFSYFIRKTYALEILQEGCFYSGEEAKIHHLLNNGINIPQKYPKQFTRIHFTVRRAFVVLVSVVTTAAIQTWICRLKDF